MAGHAIGIKLVSGSDSQWRKTAWAQKGKMDTLPTDKLCLLYRWDAAKGVYGHVGVYLGDGTVIHARGHDYGVIRDNLADGRWTHWGIPAGLYDEEETDMTLQMGDTGEDVRKLQNLLLDAGMYLLMYGADGKYGQETKNAVMRWQQQNGMPATGICDADTYAALLAAVPAAVPADIGNEDKDTKDDWAAIRQAAANLVDMIDQKIKERQ